MLYKREARMRLDATRVVYRLEITLPDRQQTMRFTSQSEKGIPEAYIFW